MDSEKKLIKVVTVVYVLQILSFITGITMIAAIIVDYMKYGEAKGTWLESHFSWQIRTFWWALLWTVIGCLTSVILIGFVILFVNAIWVVYRIVRGYIKLIDHEAV